MSELAKQEQWNSNLGKKKKEEEEKLGEEERKVRQDKDNSFFSLGLTKED